MSSLPTPHNEQPLKEYDYTVYLVPVPEGGFNVIVPAIPEICTFGETKEEALAMARDAIKLVLEDNLANGEAIPQETGFTSEKVRVAVP